MNKKDDDGECKELDVEKANIYEFGARFIYVLYGQLKDIDCNGDEYWRSLPFKGKGDGKNTNWNPKYLDLV